MRFFHATIEKIRVWIRKYKFKNSFEISDETTSEQQHKEAVQTRFTSL